MLLTFKEAPERGNYDEYPVLPAEVDPQLHLSRNDRVQPFYMTCAKDTIVVQMGGTGRVEFRDASVNYFDIEPGDFIYVPAGTEHRLHPDNENITYRYRAQHPGAESMTWRCDNCATELLRYAYDGDAVPIQAAYAAGCDAYNASSARTCKVCGHGHPELAHDAARWRALVAEIAAEDAAAVPEPAGAH